LYERLDPEIERAVGNALDVLRRLGWELRDVDLPELKTVGADAMEGIPLSGTWAGVVGSEAMSFHRPLMAKSPQLYGREVYERIAGGANVSPDAYKRAQDELVRSRYAVDAVFASIDLLVTPTTPIPACSIDTEPPIEAMRNTIPFSVYGLPTISIPCGFTLDGMPVGLQMTGPRRGEAVLFGAAAAYEQATEWHRRHPNLGGLNQPAPGGN
jgi:Asp-tRNA(Asn)/Glu-tRNA(Gln) amidotransferase A subunit family amidase